MSSKAKVLYKASFNPRIKNYIFWYGILISVVSLVGIPLLPFYLLLAYYFINKYFERLECELTTRSLRFKKGFIFHTEKTIPLDKIQDLTFKEGPLLKAFGLSILRVETAGTSVQGAADLSLIGIVDAAEFRNMVLEQRDVVTDNAGTGNAASDDNESLLVVLTEIRDTLNRIADKQ
ncbi:PH domain-containing protein [Balneola sp. MJW-20]|uniref:PH domain-containing protein n=1 Tax=Gracilimonas aurantiaca TaxID=3234185 RepID=UPI00346703E8